MSKDLNIIGLQPTMEIAPTQLTIGATSTANELKLETTYNNLLEDGSTIFTTVGGITTPHVVGTVVKTQGTAPVTTTKTITGNTTTINNSPFNNSTVPTLGNMIIVSNTARAIADNASATTFNFNLSSGNDILELQPSMKILLESIEIDPASTTSSLVLNSPYNNYIVDGTPLILDQAGIVTQVITGTVVKTATTTPTNVTFTITGATTSLPTLYAFNSTNVTVSNMTIASNVATATANAASATTFEYTASGDVTEAQAIAILQPTELDIDPSSTTGSIKVNYTTNNLLQVGSKVLVTDGGVTTEETIAAGSQSSSSLISNTDGSLSFRYINNILFALGTSTRRLLKSLDNGATWQFLTTLGGSGSANINSGCFFNGKYYLGLTYSSNQGTVNLWESSDTITWQSAHSATFTDAGSCGVATNESILVVGYGTRIGSLSVNLTMYSSTDGVIFTLRNTYTPATSNSPIYDFRYVNGVFICCAYQIGSASSDGISWGNVNFDSVFGGATFTIYYNGSNFAVVKHLSGTLTIYQSSSIGGPWFNIYSTGSGAQVTQIQFINSKYIFTASSSVYSSNSLTGGWTSASGGISGTFANLSATVNSTGRYISGNTGNVNMLTSIDYGVTWTSVDLATTTGTYQFTITSPSLPVPDAMYLGGQVLQSNVGGAGWVTHTVTYSDSSGTITFTGNNRTGLTGDTVQIRMTTINNTEVLSYFRGNLVVETADGYTYTCSAFDTPLTSVPVKAYKGGQTLLSSCTATNTPSLVAVSSYTYTRSGDIITYTGNNRTGLSGLYVQLRAATLNENDILTYFGYTYLSLDPTSGWTYTCTNINPRLTTLPGDVYYGDQQVQTNVELAGWQTHAVSEIVSIAANTFRVAYTSISSDPGKDVQLRVQDLAEEDEVSRMKLTITQD